MLENWIWVGDTDPPQTTGQGEHWIGPNQLKSCELNEGVNTGTEMMPGGTGAAELCFSLWDAPKIAEGTRLIYFQKQEMRPVKVRLAGDTLRVLASDDPAAPDGHEVFLVGLRPLARIGTFTAEKPTKETRWTDRVTAYDAMVKTDIDLTAWLLGLEEQFPIPLLEFAHMVCVRCGVELVNTELPNGEYPVQAFHADWLTGRQLLAWVGQACGRFCRATPDGKLEFAWYTPVDWRHSIGPGEDGLMLVRLAGDTLRVADRDVGVPPDGPETYRVPYKRTWYYQDSLTFEDYETAQVGQVEICQKEGEPGVVWPEGAGSGDVLRLTGNLLLTPDDGDALQAVARTLYEQFKEIAYTPCRVDVPADCGLRAGMAAWVTDFKERTFLTYVMSSTLSGGVASLECTGSPRRTSTAAINGRTQTSLHGSVLGMQTSVGGVQTAITGLEQTVGELEVIAENGEEQSVVSLVSGGEVLSRAEVRFTGLGKFVTRSEAAVGHGVCDADGVCAVVLDAHFLAVSAAERHWLLTDTSGEGHLWAEPTSDGARVHGAAGQTFDWLCVNLDQQKE